MFPFMIKMHLQTIFVVVLISIVYGQDRKINSTLNFGCTSCSSNTTTLVYVRAEGSHDTIHQIWDFTRGMPTVIYTVGDVNTTMNITWHWEGRNVPVRFKLSAKPTYSFALSIDKLYEYDDLRDRAQINNDYPRMPLRLSDVVWHRVGSRLNDSGEAMLNMRGDYRERRRGDVRTGVITMKLDLLPFKDYAVELPHLIHSANSTLIDVSLVNFTTSPEYNASRFAIHMLMTSLDSSNDVMTTDTRKSLDDEHTPGVFEIIEVKTPRSAECSDGGFMQFRPVGYTEADRSVSTSTNVYMSSFTKATFPEYSTLQAFYAPYGKDLLIEDMYISIGLPEDKFYKQHNYTSWSFTFGYGSPPVESVSLYVILIISIGLGVPVILALSGITYVLVKKYKQRRNPPEQFTDEE